MTIHAFPCGDHRDVAPRPGMDLRDWFAGQALVAMPLLNDGAYSQLARDFGDPERDAKQCATAAYRYADAMMEARACTTEPR